MTERHDRDALTRFLLERSGVRGVIVRLDDTWTSIRDRADYPAEVAARLGETCAAAGLLTGHVKVDGRLSVQLRGTGALNTLFAECTRTGHLRGLARYSEPVPNPLTPRHFGPGSMLAITIENQPPGVREPVRYQGLVGLDADTLADAFEGYFAQSEQLPTRLALAVHGGVAAGMMLQLLPEAQGDADGWDRTCALFDTLTREELCVLPVETLLWRLFHEEGVRLLGASPLDFGCSCSRERVAAMLVSLGHDEALAAAATGMAEITCEFCNQHYEFDRVDIEQLFTPPTGPAPDRPQ
jgi:molecular chaperone Hsp33